MIQESTAPVVATWPTAPCESSDHGARISVAAGVTSFFKALHPDYASGSIQMELPTLCAEPPEKDGHSLWQRTELGARMVCAYVGLPASLVFCIGGAANFSAVIRWLGSNLAVLGTDNVTIRDGENPSQARKKQRHRICHQSARLPKTAIGLGAASCLGTVAAAPAPGHWIIVNDSSVLDKIGRDPAYPLDGRYRQLADIDAGNLSAPIGNTSHPFIGEYDGCCHSIDKLRHCFVQRLGGNGRIDNTRFARAAVFSREEAGVVACELNGRATLANIVVEHSTVATDGTGASAGIGAGTVYDHSLIDGFRTFNCTTKTLGRHSDAGAVAGVVDGVVNNTRLADARVETFHDESNAGGGAGGVYGGTINNTVMIDGKVVTHGSYANAGGAAGLVTWRGTIDNTMLASTELITNQGYSHVGGGAGEVEMTSKIANTLLVNSSLRTHGDGAHAAGGGGMVRGRIINTTMVYGKVETCNFAGHAAVGAGYLFPEGRVYNTTGRQVVIRTVGVSADGAVGAARAKGVVEGVVCFKSDIMTSNIGADAGFGAGWLLGRAADVAAKGCHAATSRDRANTGFGAGAIFSSGSFRNLTVIDSTANASDSGASEAVNGGDYFFACNSSVGEYESPPCCNEHTHKLCAPVPQDVCRLADPRVLTKDCRPVAPPYFDAEKGYRFVCPPPPTLPFVEANTTATVNMTNASMISLLPATSPVPLVLTAPVAAMSTGALAGGIVAGVVALGLVGVAGFALYRHYHQPGLRAVGATRFADLDDP